MAQLGSFFDTTNPEMAARSYLTAQSAAVIPPPQPDPTLGSMFADPHAGMTHAATSYAYGAQPGEPDTGPGYFRNVVADPSHTPAETAAYAAAATPLRALFETVHGPYDAIAGAPALAQQAWAESPYATPAERGITGAVGDGDPRIDPQTSTDTAGGALNLASMFGAASAPMPKPAGSLGIFGGRNAATADIDALNEAKALRSLRGSTGYEDVDADSILKDTGWFRGLDGQWKHEIDDSKSTMIGMPQPFETARVGDVLQHPELFDAYPHLRDVPVTFDDKSAGGGGYYRDEGRITLSDAFRNPDSYFYGTGPKSVLLHELQHAVQAHEGFTNGTNAQAAGGHLRYLQNAGEVEARAVQSRANMTPEDRRAAGVWYEGGLPAPAEQWMPTSLPHVPLSYDP